MKDHNCIVILGPTASGKTNLACQLAYHLDGEIISADSRQVYKHLDIGTGKDIDEYKINEKSIPYHLIDIIEPGEQFYLHQFVEEVEKAFKDITNRQKLPVICGGTGLYLDALQKDFFYTQVKENQELRQELELLPKEVLIAKLNAYPRELVKHVDADSKKRIIRGIEVAEYLLVNREDLITNRAVVFKPYYIGVKVSTEERKQKISDRLKKRLDHGLVEEVGNLLSKDISHERLQRFGLEYKFVSLYLLQKISKEELFTQLQTAIFQYAKRQMTWFRKMQKEGVQIHWVDKEMNMESLIDQLQDRPLRSTVTLSQKFS